MSRADRVVEWLKKQPVGYFFTASELRVIMGYDTTTGNYYDILRRLEKYGFVVKAGRSEDGAREWVRAPFEEVDMKTLTRREPKESGPAL